jgi:hypothetical protein
MAMMAIASLRQLNSPNTLFGKVFATREPRLSMQPWYDRITFLIKQLIS